jgi:PAS domain S-box-containing protein
MLKQPARWRLLRRWYLPAMWILCSALPLLLFLYSADRMLRRTVAGSLLQQGGPAADLAAKIIEERAADARAFLQAIVANPDMDDAWQQLDINRLAAHLRQAHELRRDVAFWAIYDKDGFFKAGYPLSRDETTRNVASAAWFRSVMQQHATYVSGASSTLPAHELAITMAAPLGQGKATGVLAATFTLKTLKSWLTAMSLSATKWISIVDQNGFMVVPADLDPSTVPHDVSASEEVKKVIAGQAGTEFVWQAGKRGLVTRHPLPSLGWGVLLEIPAAEIDKAIWKFEKPLAVLGVIFAILAIAVGSAFAWLYRRLRGSQEYIRRIITSATDAFVAIDERGNITDWNPKAEALFGWPAAEAIGQPLHLAIIPERYREAHRRGLEHFRATGEGRVLNQSLELAAVDRTGREFPVELSIAHVRGRGKSSFNAFVRDISERRRAQQEIAHLNDELQRRLSDLEARNKELEAFSYSVSHDVRAPLRHMAGFSRMLSDECGREMSPAGREYLEQIQNAADRMHQLVDDLLRFARLGEQGLKLQMTDLRELVRDVVSGLEPDFAGRKVNFEVTALPTLECDRMLMKQVFWNLLSNAVKFTTTRDQAVIAVGQCRQKGEEVLFVRDNGVGFNMKYADKLFAPFQRLHTQDEFEGTGVGLAIVQRIILKHGGHIWAEAEPDRGTSFFFSLPVPQAAGASRAHA